MYLKKAKIIQLFCILVLVSCQRNDIEVFNGPNTNINDLNGNWILINYWADWCAPCIKEIPELNDFASEKREDAFLVNSKRKQKASKSSM